MILYSMMNARGSLQDKENDMANESFSIKGVVSLIDKNTGKVLFTKQWWCKVRYEQKACYSSVLKQRFKIHE